MDMFQKILFFITFFFFLHTAVFANQKVEDVFIDIDSNYKYLSELQTLYDKGIIQPNIHNKFKPYELLSREEFVWILMETNCVQCIKPNVNYDLIDQFQSSNVYYDVHNNSDYFYCISSADNAWYIQWYQAGTVCENWNNNQSSVPFCPDNTIILEEALAIVMRAWNILTKQQANNFINNIKNWENYPDLSDDVKSKNADGSIYDFYPYFYEADRFTITEYNNFWEEIKYSLLEKKSGKYFPKKSINREEFLKIAIFALKNSSCLAPSNEWISWEINIFDSGCASNNSQCEYENDFNTQESIDLVWDLDTTCLLGFWENTAYKWIINNLSNNTESIQTWKYLDDVLLSESWKYKVDLYVTDLCNNSSKITKYISVSWSDEDEFIASINKEYRDLFSVNFEWIVEWNTWEYTYLWDFGDGNTSNEKNPNHIYSQSWEYDVTLTVIDKNWVEKQIPTTVNFIDTDFNVAIKKEVADIWDSDFIQFYGLTNSDNPNLTYLWDFGDGNTSNEKNPLHNYAPWIYIVTLTVTDEYGNEKQVTTQIIISDGDFVINASVDTIEINTWLEATFTPTIDWWIWPFSYSWDLGDGNTSNEEIPTHTYWEPWIYTVELTVTDSQGNTQTTYTQVIVSAAWMNTEINTSANQNNSWEFTFTPNIDGWTWPFSYSWDLGDGNTSNEEIPTHIYQESWTYIVTLTTIDSNWLISISQTTVVVITSETNDFNIELSGNPLTWPGPLTSNLSVVVQWWIWPFTYSWDFGDGETGIGKNITHTFSESGTYTVTVTVTDSNWNIQIETIIITVWFINSDIDTDLDWILDKDDKCPIIKWKSENQGCPIFEETCNFDSDCSENSMCWKNTKWISTCIPVAIKNNCEYNWESTVFWNIICNTCPCQNVLDFKASLRNCDVVFPAITSPDWSEIYSKWNYYQIKK